MWVLDQMASLSMKQPTEVDQPEDHVLSRLPWSYLTVSLILQDTFLLPLEALKFATYAQMLNKTPSIGSL